MPNTDVNMDGDSGGSHPTALQPQVVQLALPRWQVQHGNFWWDIPQETSNAIQEQKQLDCDWGFKAYTDPPYVMLVNVDEFNVIGEPKRCTNLCDDTARWARTPCASALTWP